MVGVHVGGVLIDESLDDQFAVLQVERRAIKGRNNGICSVGCDRSADRRGCGLVDELGVSAKDK